MHACVTTFRLRTGPGPQTVTGIVDQDGVAFTPDVIFAVNGGSTLDTLYSNAAGPQNATSANTNVYVAATGETGYNGVADAWSGGPMPVGFKVGTSGSGQGPAAGICSIAASVPGGTVYRTVQITAVALGSFSLAVISDDVTIPTDVLILALAANAGDFQIAFVPPGAGPTFPTPFEPKGLLNPKTMVPATTGPVAAVTGGYTGWGWGWDSPRGGPMSSHVYLGGSTGAFSHAPSSHQSIVSPDGFITVNPTGAWPTDQVATDNPWVTAWSPTSITFAAPPDPNRRGFVLGGPLLVTASGRATQQPTLGPQVITTGIAPVVIFLMTCGAARNPALLVSAEMCFGVGCGGTHGIQQGSFWVAESSDGTTASEAFALTGASYLSASTIVRTSGGLPNAQFTEFPLVAALTEINPAAASFTITWSATTPVFAAELLWFAIGLAPAPVPPAPPPPPSTPSVRSWRIHRIDHLGRDEFSS